MRLDFWRRKQRPTATLPDSVALTALLQKALLELPADERKIMQLIMGRNPQGSADVDQTNYLQAYQTSLWANACTMALAKACASVPLKLRAKDTQDDIEKSPLLDLLAYVNHDDNWPWFMGAIVSYRCLAGEAFVCPNTLGGGPPTSLYLLRPDRMTPNAPGGVLKSWTYKVGGQEQTLPANEVIQLKRWSPLNDLRGQPVLQAAEISLNLDIAVRKYNNSFLRGGAIPPFMLTAEGTLNEVQVAQIEAAWQKKHGSPDKAGKPFIHGNGLKLEILSDGKKEGGFVDLAKLSKQEVLAAFGVPPIIVGDYSDASVLANAEVQRQEFWRRTVLDGEMTEVLGVLNQTLVPLFGDNLELYADESAMPQLQEDEGTRWQRVQQAVGGPFLKINEGREMLGLEPLGEEGDVVLVDPNKLPLGEEPPPPLEPSPPVAMPNPPENMPPAAMPEEEEKPAPPPPPPAKSVRIQPVRHKSLVGEFGSPAHQAHFKDFVARLEPRMVSLRRAVAGVYRELMQEVIANLEAEAGDKALSVWVPDFRKQGVVDAYLFDLDEAGKKIVDAAMPIIGKTLDDGGKRALAELTGGVWNMERPEVVRWLQTKELKISTLPASLRDTIRQQLAAGVTDGQNLRAIADRLRELEPGYERWMADRVARTEVVGANNAGSLECYKQNEVAQKEWSTAEDSKVRDGYDENGNPLKEPFDHQSMHGKVVGVNEDFIVSGEPMDAPGDQSRASAGNVANCRCAVLPVVE